MYEEAVTTVDFLQLAARHVMHIKLLPGNSIKIANFGFSS
jgi:hypothetical protein